LKTKKYKLFYYGDETEKDEKGYIDLKEIVDIQYSTVFDAPPFSLDLITSEKHYTIVAESNNSMLLWAYALTTVLKKQTDSPNKKSVKISSEGFKFEKHGLVPFIPHSKFEYRKIETLTFSHFSESAIFKDLTEKNMLTDGFREDLLHDCFQITNEAVKPILSYFTISFFIK
jgi:hypothetical protein